jgi:cephalosporin hydroxylase
MDTIESFFLYKNLHTTQQVKNIKSFFEFFLKEEKFDIIIELGTSLAGLTYIIDDICVENGLNKVIHTFDFSHKDYVEDQLKERNVEYHVMDETTDEFKSFVTKLIKNNEKVLLLCDGGSKIEEFDYYSNFLKFGDFIMAHDYAYDRETFTNKIENKIWNWFEIKHEDIKNSIINNNLIEYGKIDFKEAAWCCYKKI